MQLFQGTGAGLRTSAQDIEARDLQWQLGGLTLRVARARLESLSARFTPAANGRPPRLQQADIGRLQLMGVEVDEAELPDAAPPHGEPWRLDALAGLQGLVHAFVTDAVWVVDAEVQLRLRDGRIDFNGVSVEHIGPDSSMGISRGGVYVDSPKLGREYLYLFTANDVPGARFETLSSGRVRRITDRGQLDLRAFVEGLLAQQPHAWPGKLADRHVAGTLDRTRLTAELQLGDGALGAERQHVVLSGRADGKNRVIVSAAVLSHKLVVRMPDMAASAAQFDLPGLTGSSGAVSADVSLRVAGLGGQARPMVALSLGHLRVENLRLQERQARRSAATAADDPAVG
ncbi:hypothetical protein M8A51_05510 [Schlegelella sp. S2-27]|uniref:AsmA-like C-terminal domain-containing protein n=1 Tax=Caldimonas mangrovi TaxID=2944811 RepID=A0ABT0YJS4_9BURK|nr:hypothetical protein [Caldimonas mangrovi]MCM5678986.1 hypothetical protein [Caldimonas mangrovi]